MRSGFIRVIILLAGILLGQVVVYGPSLTGRKILLPLDILAQPSVCIPPPAGKYAPPAEQPLLTDLVLQNEPARRFAAAELHSGRYPLWNSFQYAGVPHTLLSFSPFGLLGALFESPRVLPWIELLAAIISGSGAYLFFKRALGISFWPAAMAAWCYPLTGFFILWQGFGIALAAVWLPWMLLVVHQIIRPTDRRSPVGLAIVTCLTLISGKLDVAGQVLLASGLYAIWCWIAANRGRFLGRPAMATAATIMLGWGLGFLLAAPGILPLTEYARTGARIQQRSKGEEERPPIGLKALPQAVLPDMYGSDSAGSLRLRLRDNGAGGNISESSAATYAGLLATLFVAPLAWCSRRHRSANIFWVVLIFTSLSWTLNVPGMVAILRLPGLNMMSHNRFVFAGTFAILALAAVGLEVLCKGELNWRKWFWLPASLLAAIFTWNIFRTIVLPDFLRTSLPASVLAGKPVGWVTDSDGVRQVQGWFVEHYAVAAILSALGILGWLILRLPNRRVAWLAPVCGVLLMGDLLWFAHDRRTQSDPALYYPAVPALEQVRNAGPGRVIASDCLPATLAQMYGLHDIRGYDAIDPARLMDLMRAAIDPRSTTAPYALTVVFMLNAELVPPDGIRLPPVLDMLGVRHVIFRGSPPSNFQPEFQSPDYWVVANRPALPRVFVPGRIETVTDDRERVQKITSLQFNPREVAYVEVPVDLTGPCRGSAQLIDETSTRVRVAAKMETPGLVVLSDLWDEGWHAYLEGRPVPILRANHAVRGVVVPVGTATLEFRYEPASLAWAIRSSLLSAAILMVWWLKARLNLFAPSPSRRSSLSSTPPGN